jgi:hypothetical protein
MNAQKSKSPLLWILLAVPVGLFSLCCLGSCVATLVGVKVDDDLERNQNGDNIAQSEPKTAATNVAAAEPAPEAPPFEEIRKNMQDMTDAQWNKYGASLTGSHVSWTGWVEEVNEKVFGGYEVWIDMDAPETAISVQDVYADIPEDLAMELRKGQKVRVSGTIDSVTNVLGALSVRLKKGATVTQ